MLQRFLTLLLFGVLSIVAIERFESRSKKSEVKQSSPAVTAEDSSDVRTMDDGNPLPPHEF